jgi:hypothetical protein
MAIVFHRDGVTADEAEKLVAIVVDEALKVRAVTRRSLFDGVGLQ